MAKKLFVGNLSFKATEQEVREMFSQYGEVHSVNIINDRVTGKPRGFCFVEMDNADSAMKELNGKMLSGRPLNVNEAKERSPREGSQRPS